MIAIYNPDWYVRDELQNICLNYPLFPGKTIDHRTARECVDRGWAERNRNGDFLPTTEGLRVNETPMPALKLIGV